MFGFGKISKTALANKIISLSTEASEEFLEYLKEDSDLCKKDVSWMFARCMNDASLLYQSSI